MNHSFNTDIAEEAGIIPAILLENIAHWIRRNKANKENFFDSDFWTFSSVAAWSELFPYMTKDQIRRGLEKLESLGFIKTGNFNKSSYDRTKWYSLMPKAWGFYGKSNCENSQIQLAKMPNGKGENAEPIPDINKDITTDITSINPDGLIVTSVTADDHQPSAIDEEHHVKLSPRFPVRIRKSLLCIMRFYPCVRPSEIGRQHGLRCCAHGGARTGSARIWATGNGFLSTSLPVIFLLARVGTGHFWQTCHGY